MVQTHLKSVFVCVFVIERGRVCVHVSDEDSD